VSDLTGFLLARIAEDEEEARTPVRSDGQIARFQARVLAECEAKRRIVERWRLYSDAEYPDYEGGYSSAMDDVLALLALPYADHPDYEEQWTP